MSACGTPQHDHLLSVMIHFIQFGNKDKTTINKMGLIYFSSEKVYMLQVLMLTMNLEAPLLCKDNLKSSSFPRKWVCQKMTRETAA